MPRDLIHQRTRNAFREHLVARSVLRDIDDIFRSADIPCDDDYEPQMSGERRCLVERYYRSLDFTTWRDAERALTAYEWILTDLEDRILETPADESDELDQVLTKLVRQLERDGFAYRDGRIAPNSFVPVRAVHATAHRFDLPELQRQVQRMEAAVEKDPGLAVGTAKEVVETTCKTILVDRGIEDFDADDMLRLIKRVRAELRLLPDDIPEAAKGSRVTKRLLSNLGSVVQGMVELRNLYGTGHGRDGRRRGIEPRHARLAVGAAAALSVFLFETHLKRRVSTAR